MLINKATHFAPLLWALMPLHYEMAIWGWLIPFVMGTAYWMFPKYLQQPIRGSSLMAWFMFCTYFIGLAFLLFDQLSHSHFPAGLTGRILLLTGILLFALLMWKRVISYRK